jgi:zinc transporter 5/7
MAFFFVELIYGYMSNSLGLISDAFHMLFDCMALFIGLSASYISQLKSSDNEYTYGYGKIETISGLFNGIFLVFISYNILCESVERIFEPIKI